MTSHSAAGSWVGWSEADGLDDLDDDDKRNDNKNNDEYIALYKVRCEVP